jgi:hypothetical protein
MRQSPESGERPLFGRNAYLWTFIPAVVLLSLVVVVICLVALLLGRIKAGIV